MVFGHLGDGNLHIVVGVGDKSLKAEVESVVYAGLPARGGSVSAEHGIGIQKKPYLSMSRSSEELALMRTLKQALDPNQILNPGKILS
jgi:FAD/FMN-containing dehydrogenase